MQRINAAKPQYHEVFYAESLGKPVAIIRRYHEPTQDKEEINKKISVPEKRYVEKKGAVCEVKHGDKVCADTAPTIQCDKPGDGPHMWRQGLAGLRSLLRNITLSLLL
jgi:hypothetical protein